MFAAIKKFFTAKTPKPVAHFAIMQNGKFEYKVVSLSKNFHEYLYFGNSRYASIHEAEEAIRKFTLENAWSTVKVINKD